MIYIYIYIYIVYLVYKKMSVYTLSIYIDRSIYLHITCVSHALAGEKGIGTRLKPVVHLHVLEPNVVK
jgi:hypothetical protein